MSFVAGMSRGFSARQIIPRCGQFSLMEPPPPNRRSSLRSSESRDCIALANLAYQLTNAMLLVLYYFGDRVSKNDISDTGMKKENLEANAKCIYTRTIEVDQSNTTAEKLSS